MRDWNAERVAGAAGADLLRDGDGGPSRVVIDSRSIAPGDLFVAIPGERVDGGRFAADALRGGRVGRAGDARVGADARRRGGPRRRPTPSRRWARLARGWRRALGARVIGVTGSVGKTSTKDLIAALIAPQRTVAASRANFNTEIGLPLELLAAPAGTDVLVLELAMRGFGQIAELTAICEPDVGVITNIGPVHLEQMGSLEGVARAKAELLVGMRDGGVAVVPAGERLLDPYLRDALEVVTFGPGGDVRFAEEGATVVLAGDDRIELDLPFASRHNLTNTLAAVAAARAVGVTPHGHVDVAFGALRGERVVLARGATVVNDCYNANPLSMRAALDDLATQEPTGRRVAVLGDMLELGPEEAAHHRAIGAHARDAGVEVLIAVGPRAAAMLETFGAGEAHAVADAAAAAALADEVVATGDVVLVKGSRGVGLEVVAEALSAERTGAGG